jgi:general secretion pathway protein G
MLLIPQATLRRRERRAGFTLIELMVVIVIIALLMGLLLGAVMKVRGRATDAANAIEIGQLATAIEAFKRKYNVDYIPSQIKLDEQCTYGGASPTALDTFSKLYLRKLWPRINLTPVSSGGTGIDWNGNSSIDATAVVLEGHQCLVFFLGGIPVASGGNLGCIGFADDPTNPANLTAATRQPAFYEFKSARLRSGTGGFFSYADAYSTGSPFLYFSHYQAGNDYNTASTPKTGFTNVPDCGVSFPGVSPYKDLTGRYIEPNLYQIISAGRDGAFGPGGTWNPNTGYASSSPGADDMANFSTAALGSAQN